MGRQDKVPVVPGLSCAQIEKMANRLIQLSHPNLLRDPGPFPIDDFFEFQMRSILGFDYEVRELPPSIEGATDFFRKVVTLSPETYYLMVAGDGRARFTVSHEVSHVALHQAVFREMLIENRRTIQLFRADSIPIFQNPEYQANCFASSLLMPAKQVANILRQGGNLNDIVKTFNVSRQAAEVKVNKLNLFLKR